jgi:hypothetical protein
MRFRLQFSLRMLLLLMAIIAIGLAIFRWPWEETTVGSSETRSERYRRAWDWRRLRHGQARTADNVTGLPTYEADYVDDLPLRARFYDPPGTLAKQQFYLWDRDEFRTWDYSHLGSYGFILEETLSGKNRNHKEWKTPAGEVLESRLGNDKKYTDDEFVFIDWNGRPVAEETNRVLADLPGAKERAAWTSPLSTPTKAPAFMGDQTYQFSVSNSGDSIPYCSGERTNKQRVQFKELYIKFE